MSGRSGEEFGDGNKVFSERADEGRLERNPRLLDANAPKGYGHLRPGASTQAIQAAQKAMGLKLPPDVKASYRIHDGQRNDPGLIGREGWFLLSLQEMVEIWRRWSRHDPQYASRLPIATGGAGDFILVDLGRETADSGRLFVQRSDSDKPDPVAPSFQSCLEHFAEKLEDDEFAYSEDDGETCMPTRSTSIEQALAGSGEAGPGG